MTDVLPRTDHAAFRTWARYDTGPPDGAIPAWWLPLGREGVPTSKVYRHTQPCRGGRERRPGHGIDT